MAELHPVGTFNDAKIIDHGYDKSPEKKTPYLWARFETGSGVATGRFYLSEGAIDHTLEKVEAMGFMGDSLAELADGTALKGSICQITVEHETYEEKTTARVGFVNPNNTIMGPSRDEEVASNVKQFDQLWKSRKAGKTSDESDVPF